MCNSKNLIDYKTDEKDDNLTYVLIKKSVN